MFEWFKQEGQEVDEAAAAEQEEEDATQCNGMST